MRRTRVSAGLCVALCVLAWSAAARGGEITGRPSVRSALAMAGHYWGRTAGPVHVVTTRAARADDTIAYADVDAHTIELMRLFFRTYPLGQPDRLWALTAVIVHEYGHLLGHGHGLYPDDPLAIMSSGEGYLRWPGAPYAVYAPASDSTSG
jgi:hypothetical protein